MQREREAWRREDESADEFACVFTVYGFSLPSAGGIGLREGGEEKKML